MPNDIQATKLRLSVLVLMLIIQAIMPSSIPGPDSAFQKQGRPAGVKCVMKFFLLLFNTIKYNFGPKKGGGVVENWI